MVLLFCQYPTSYSGCKASRFVYGITCLLLASISIFATMPHLEVYIILWQLGAELAIVIILPVLLTAVGVWEAGKASASPLL